MKNPSVALKMCAVYSFEFVCLKEAKNRKFLIVISLLPTAQANRSHGRT